MASWGFDIEISQEYLAVTRNALAYDSATQKRRRLLFCLGAVVSGLLCMMVLFASWKRMQTPHHAGAIPVMLWIVSLLSAGFPFSLAIVSLYPDIRDLKATRDHFRIIRRAFGKTMVDQSYPRRDVSGIRYVDDSPAWAGLPSYLGFFAGSKWVKCLPGLKSIEARQILTVLAGFGYDVASDPAMAAMIQMENSRRRVPHA
jgi:hypothetical protein